MNAERYVVVGNDRHRRRAGGDRVHHTVPVCLDAALEQAEYQREIAKAGGRDQDWYRVCELVDVGHGGGTDTGDSAQAKAVLMARFGLTEPAAHGMLQRLAKDLRLNKVTAARILLAGISAVLADRPASPAAQADADALAAARAILTRRVYLEQPEAGQSPATLLDRLEQLLLRGAPPAGEAAAGG